MRPLIINQARIIKVDMTDTTATIEPNKFYVWGEVASLDISLAPEIAGIENIYKFQFQSGAIATTLTLPNNVSIDGDYPNAIKTIYIVSIESNIAKIERKRKEAILPTAYQQVEYIKSTGTQYINTGIEGNGLLTISLDMQADTDQQWCFGCSYMWPNNLFLMCNFGDGVAGNLFAGYGNNKGTSAEALANDGQRHIYLMDRGNVVIDSSILRQYATTSFITISNVALFAYCDVSNNYYNKSTCSIYQATISNQGTTLADIYPCYRTSDNVAGMYDIVRNVFLTNAGTGSFIVGPDI